MARVLYQSRKSNVKRWWFFYNFTSGIGCSIGAQFSHTDNTKSTLKYAVPCHDFIDKCHNGWYWHIFLHSISHRWQPIEQIWAMKIAPNPESCSKTRFSLVHKEELEKLPKFGIALSTSTEAGLQVQFFWLSCSSRETSIYQISVIYLIKL